METNLQLKDCFFSRTIEAMFQNPVLKRIFSKNHWLSVEYSFQFLLRIKALNSFMLCSITRRVLAES